MKRLEFGQAANVRWFGTGALGIAGFGIVDENSLAKFTAISIHAWYGAVRDADRLCALAFGGSLLRSKNREK